MTIPDVPTLLTCRIELYKLVVSALGTLFDPMGTDCLSVLASTRDPYARRLTEEFIEPTWTRLRTDVVRVRGNLGHHAPYHPEGFTFGQQRLEELPTADVVRLVYAVHLASSWHLIAEGVGLNSLARGVSTTADSRADDLEGFLAGEEMDRAFYQ